MSHNWSTLATFCTHIYSTIITQLVSNLSLISFYKKQLFKLLTDTPQPDRVLNSLRKPTTTIHLNVQTLILNFSLLMPSVGS